MKMQLNSLFGILILSILTVGCSSSPFASRGGLGEHHIELLDPFYEDEPISKDNAILFEFELLRQQIAVLVLEGGKVCFPATVLELERLEQRISREIAGNMMFDATNDIIILRHLAHRLERQLDYVLEHEICIPPTPRKRAIVHEHTLHGHALHDHGISMPDMHDLSDEDTPATDVEPSNSPSEIVESKDDRLAKVLRLLNADNQFAVDSSEVNLKYVGRLAVAAEILVTMPDVDLTIIGYADTDGNEGANQLLGAQRAENVLRYLHAFGIPKERMQVQSKGEQEPLFKGAAPHILLTNRRVEIILLPTQNEESE